MHHPATIIGMHNRIDEQRRREAEARAALEAEYGQVWNTDEMVAEFTVVGFAAPWVEVIRRSDGKRGSLEFRHSPRFYFDFVED